MNGKSTRIPNTVGCSTKEMFQVWTKFPKYAEYLLQTYQFIPMYGLSYDSSA